MSGTAVEAPRAIHVTDVFGVSDTRNPRKPYGVGCKTSGSRSFAWEFGSEDVALQVMEDLERGILDPREVF